jgi:hypothetical protein
MGRGRLSDLKLTFPGDSAVPDELETTSRRSANIIPAGLIAPRRLLKMDLINSDDIRRHGIVTNHGLCNAGMLKNCKKADSEHQHAHKPSFSLWIVFSHILSPVFVGVLSNPFRVLKSLQIFQVRRFARPFHSEYPNSNNPTLKCPLNEH